ncbi:hypothetical protein ABBQ38_015318 [Trebouxia sp. C0009 RCD-2024]
MVTKREITYLLRKFYHVSSLEQSYWEMYRGVLNSFMNATDLPEEALLDVKGNHDSFDVPVSQGSKIRRPEL